MNRTFRSTSRSASPSAALAAAPEGDPRSLRAASLLLGAALALTGLATPAASFAQDEDESAGESRAGYAWGEGGSTSAARSADDPMRIMAFVGAGAGFRLLRNLDPPFAQEFLVPAYMDFGAALYLEGGDFRHGPSFYISPLIMNDAGGSPVQAGEQWVLTPGYSLMLPFQRLLNMTEDLVQLQVRVGIPIVFSTGLSDGTGVDVALGGELGLALHVKFLAGLGVYLEGQASVYGGSLDTAHPTITFDAGFLIDYELLP